MLRKILSKPSRILKKKPFGICFIIPVYNEEKTIRRCIISILDFADQIIILDSSKDNTFNEIKDLIPDPKIHYKYFIKTKNSFFEKLNYGLSLVKYRYVFKFGGDMVLDLKALIWRSRLEKIKKNIVVDLGHINIDINGIKSEKGKEALIFTWDPSLRWIKKHHEQIKGRLSFGGRFPLFYEIKYFPELYITHYDLKTGSRKKNRRKTFGFND